MKTCPDYPRTRKSSPFFRIFAPTILIYSFISVFAYWIIVPRTDAFTPPVGHLNVQVSAAIGQYYVSFSGFIAPFASVVLTTDNQIMRSVAADSGGYFSISQVLVKQGFDHFCFTAVDVKRLGESEACFKIPPVTGQYEKKNIFLPPTIGLFRTEINAGSNAIMWGYSMPGAVVSVHSSDGKIFTTTADKTGYYQVTTTIEKAGSYDLYATATLNKQDSEKPTNKVTLLALTFAQSTTQAVSNWLKNLLTFLFNLPLGPLWLAVPILILIFILWRKLQNKPLFPTSPKKAEKLFFDYLFKNRKLHHHWMKGIGF